MKIYQIAIIGVCVISLMSFLAISNSGKAIAKQINEVMVANFPELQNVFITNTEPINVNVANQSSSPQPPYDVNVLNFPAGQGALEPKVITLFDYECDDPWVPMAKISPVINTKGYSKIVFYGDGNLGCTGTIIRPSLDNIDWDRSQQNIENTSFTVKEIVAPYYRVDIGRTSPCPTPVCFGLKAYLIP